MSPKPCWIDTIEFEEAVPELKAIYDRVKGPDGQLDNLYKAFSLRPHTILPADDLYRAALHHQDNSLSKRFSELLGCLVAVRTGCNYALAHHGSNFTHLNGNDAQSAQILECLAADDLESCGTPQEVGALRYARMLCDRPQDIKATDIDVLREQGWNDGDILEIAQIVGMFSYFTRIINGIGIQLGNEKLGLY